ncbi:MAG TPA: DUF2059 domain-containing protein [Sphingomonas sp.]|nr:DUF2059 domain-containing protein [Sphingomonas sp.]
MSALFALLLIQAAPQVPPPAPPAVTAIEPARLEAAKRLVGAFNLEKTFDLMFVQLTPAFAQAVIGQMAMNPDTKDVIDTLITRDPGNRDRMVAVLSQEFLRSIQSRYPALLEKAAQEYAAAFTADEMTAIANFYASGPGAKALALVPQMQAKMSAHGEALGRQAGEEAGRRAFEKIARDILPPEKGTRS